MRIFTKEWHILLESFGNIDMFEPIEDKEYSDEDIPEWVRESVDPRRIALGLLPQSVYDRLEAEDAENETKFEELDAEADRLLEENDELFPEEYEELADSLDDLVAEYITGAALVNGDYVMELVVWDDEGEQTKKKAVFKNAELIENEEPIINSGTDEDGDIETDCDLADCELYFKDGAFEVHMLLDNEDKGFKYVTLKCDEIIIE